MGDEQKTCSECGWPIAGAEAFCGHCGSAVARASGDDSAEDSRPAVPVQADAAATKEAGRGLPPPAEPEPHGPGLGKPESSGRRASEAFRSALDKWAGGSAPAPASPAGPSDATPDETVESECPDLIVRLDQALFMVDTMTSTIHLQVTALEPDVEDVKIEVSADFPGADNTAGQSWTKLKRVHRRKLDRRRASRELLLGGLRPPQGIFGSQVLRWKVRYLREGRRVEYEAETEHRIYPKSESMDEVLDQVVYNIRVDGHANDVQLGEFKKHFEGMKRRTLSAMIDRAQTAPRLWTALGLLDCEDGALPESDPPKAARVERLTLQVETTDVEAAGRYIHLIGRRLVSVGRHRVDKLTGRRTNDLVARVFDQKGRLLDGPSGRVSRHHCYFERKGNDCWLVDLSSPLIGREKERGRPSQYGTQLDGVRVAAGGSAPLPVGREFRVSLAVPEGKTGRSDPPVFELLGELSKCDVRETKNCPFPNRCGPSTPVALRLRRTRLGPGLEAESFVVLWGQVNLGKVDPMFEQLRAYRDRNAFAWSCGRKRGWLIPGTVVSTASGRKVRVDVYEPWGM